jgi:hypothetical protein
MACNTKSCACTHPEQRPQDQLRNNRLTIDLTDGDDDVIFIQIRVKRARFERETPSETVSEPAPPVSEPPVSEPPVPEPSVPDMLQMARAALGDPAVPEPPVPEPSVSDPDKRLAKCKLCWRLFGGTHLEDAKIVEGSDRGVPVDRTIFYGLHHCRCFLLKHGGPCEIWWNDLSNRKALQDFAEDLHCWAQERSICFHCAKGSCCTYKLALRIASDEPRGMYTFQGFE